MKTASVETKNGLGYVETQDQRRRAPRHTSAEPLSRAGIQRREEARERAWAWGWRSPGAFWGRHLHPVLRDTLLITHDHENHLGSVKNAPDPQTVPGDPSSADPC